MLSHNPGEMEIKVGFGMDHQKSYGELGGIPKHVQGKLHKNVIYSKQQDQKEVNFNLIYKKYSGKLRSI